MSQAVIQSLEPIIVDLPTIHPYKLAVHATNRQTLVILRLHCSDSVEGLDEATTIGDLAYDSESPENIGSNLDAHFASLLPGQPADNVNAAMQHLGRHTRGNTLARSAVETALFDAHSRRLGLAVSELLGGHLHDSLEVAWTLANGDAGRDIEEVEQVLDLRRHQHFELKTGAGEVDADVTHAITIRRILGKHASVRVDVNQAWDEGVAQHACTTLDDNGIALIEQPIARHNRIGLVRLSSRDGAPIMADEVIGSIENAFHPAREGATPVFALETARNDGPCAVPRSAAVVGVARIGLYGGTVLGGSIGILAATHAFVTLNRLA